MEEIVIHLNCPDQKGIVAEFTHKLYESKVNIISLFKYSCRHILHLSV